MPKLALHLALDGPIVDIVARLDAPRQAGVDAVYVIEGVRDPFVPLTAIAAATERVEIGAYVANAYARTPQAAATAALAIDELSGGRLMFGIGAGNRHINEWLFGLAMDRPMGKMRGTSPCCGHSCRATSGTARGRRGDPPHRDAVRAPARPADPDRGGRRCATDDRARRHEQRRCRPRHPDRRRHLAEVVRPQRSRRAKPPAVIPPTCASRWRRWSASTTTRRWRKRAPAGRSWGCSTRSHTRTTTTCCGSRATPTSPRRRRSWRRRSAGTRPWRRSTTSCSTG